MATYGGGIKIVDVDPADLTSTQSIAVPVSNTVLGSYVVPSGCYAFLDGAFMRVRQFPSGGDPLNYTVSCNVIPPGGLSGSTMTLFTATGSTPNNSSIVAGYNGDATKPGLRIPAGTEIRFNFASTGTNTFTNPQIDTTILLTLFSN